MSKPEYNNKVLVLGIDGMDPRLTRRFVDMGIMPNTKKLIENGSCRKDLMLLGGHPTVTPSMWTTLGTGTYSMTHGITEFYLQSPDNPEMMLYGLDSRDCKAEQVWNAFAEAGKKTLVWHWPGSSWPPSSDSENLYVVDGTSPGTVNMASGQRDAEFMVGASETVQSKTFIRDVNDGMAAPCLIEDLEMPDEEAAGIGDLSDYYLKREIHTIVHGYDDGQIGAQLNVPMNICQSSLKPAENWANAPEGAKEFSIMYSKGLINRPCLALKNEDGVYDRVAIYKSKKDTEPMAVIKVGEFKRDIVDQAIKDDVVYEHCQRDIKLMEIDPEGTKLRMYVSAAMDNDFDGVFHPKSLHQIVADNVGCPPPSFYLDGRIPEAVQIMLEGWYHIADWQANSLNYLIEHEGFEAIFSHYHNVDLQMHRLVGMVSDRGFDTLSKDFYEKAFEDIYKQTDYFIGQFVHLIDEGWSVIVCSDHGQVASKYMPPLIGDMLGLNIGLMKELGYTVMKKDENGNDTTEIDWTKTTAWAMQGTGIYINTKGKWPTGIVEPEAQYELEEQIMTDLYSYKHPATGKRVIACALRKKDAILLGVGGEGAGDICFWTAEGYNFDHTDSLSTTWGELGTSVSPIFIAAGAGIKKNNYITRYVREVDVAPTAAVLAGVRMPRDCEGAPAYQIFDQEY